MSWREFQLRLHPLIVAKPRANAVIYPPSSFRIASTAQPQWNLEASCHGAWRQPSPEVSAARMSERWPGGGVHPPRFSRRRPFPTSLGWRSSFRCVIDRLQCLGDREQGSIDGTLCIQVGIEHVKVAFGVAQPENLGKHRGDPIRERDQRRHGDHVDVARGDPAPHAFVSRATRVRIRALMVRLRRRTYRPLSTPRARPRRATPPPRRDSPSPPCPDNRWPPLATPRISAPVKIVELNCNARPTASREPEPAVSEQICLSGAGAVRSLGG